MTLYRYRNLASTILVTCSVLLISVIYSPSVNAQACPAADADDGSTDSIITINDGGTTNWTDTDGTAFDCATLSLHITSSSTLHIVQDDTNGYKGKINVINVTVDAGSNFNAASTALSESFPSPNTNNS